MNYSLTDILTLIGSLGLFLYGMQVMSNALMKVAGNKMRNILASMTSNRFFGVITGFIITALIQSSSATTLMIVSFVNAGLLTLTESVGVIMGANIGTTVTAWLITILGFEVSMSAIALPLIGFGFALSLTKKELLKNWGNFIIGFSILFIGLQFLKNAVPDLNENPEILKWLRNYTDMGYWSILLFLLIGTIMTVILQSSSATMALTFVMCYEGWIPFDMAAAIILGENIGTTITANMAAFVANDNAKRTARAHFIFNVIGVIWMLILFTPFLTLVSNFVTQKNGSSPFETPEMIPVALSVFHTSFNIINTFILIWFVPQIVKIVEKLIPYKTETVDVLDQPKYLSKNALKYPQTAIQALINETKRLYEGPLFKVVTHGFNFHRGDIKSELKPKKITTESKDIIEINIDDFYYNKIKSIYSAIIEFGTQAMTKFTLSSKNADAIQKIRMANRNIVETVKDVKLLEKNVNQYMNSDNEHIQNEYFRLRKRVAITLKEIYATVTSENPEDHAKKLKKLRHKIEKSDVMIDGTLDELIRNKHISSEIATSIANDSRYVIEICKLLILTAELLYVKTDALLEGFPGQSNE